LWKEKKMEKLKMVIPKGRMFEKLCGLLQDAGIHLQTNDRFYIPYVSDLEIEAKILKAQNIAKLVELGAHDIGFTGYDWVLESKAEVEEILDLQLDPVTIVAAIPACYSLEKLGTDRIMVASEYKRIATRFLEKEGFDYHLIRTFGATEAYPPEDADMIIDNTSTGRTLKEHKLKVVAEIMTSSTRLIANRQSLSDPWKKSKIESLTMLFSAVLNARGRVMLEMNVAAENLEEVVDILPCMRAPTVSPLYLDQGYAVKVAVPRGDTVTLIPRLKELGVTDILEYEFKKVVV
jgi:ATP phosphoribosyltransferase